MRDVVDEKIHAPIMAAVTMRSPPATTHVGHHRFGGTSGTTAASFRACVGRDRVESNGD